MSHRQKLQYFLKHFTLLAHGLREFSPVRLRRQFQTFFLNSHVNKDIELQSFKLVASRAIASIDMQSMQNIHIRVKFVDMLAFRQTSESCPISFRWHWNSLAFVFCFGFSFDMSYGRSRWGNRSRGVVWPSTRPIRGNINWIRLDPESWLGNQVNFHWIGLKN